MFERKPAASMTPIQTMNAAPATFFEMAGGYDHNSESSSNSDDSPVFNCGKKERKNSVLQDLIEESKERHSSFADMAFAQLKLDDQDESEKTDIKLIDGDDPLF